MTQMTAPPPSRRQKKPQVFYRPTLTNAEIMALPCTHNRTKAGRGMALTAAGAAYVEKLKRTAWLYPFGRAP